MEQRGVVLGAIARVLNAGGSALVNVYDAVASLKAGVGPGEKGRLKARLRECEKKLARLYLEIGKEVAVRETAEQMSATGEAGIKLAAEYRAEAAKIRQRLQEMEEEEKAAREAALARARKRPEPAPRAAEPASVEAPETVEVSADPVTEERKEIVVVEAETPAAFVLVADHQQPAEIAAEEKNDIVADAEEAQTPEMEPESASPAEPEDEDLAEDVVTEEAVAAQESPKAPSDSMEPVIGEALPDAVTEAGAAPEALATMLKSDLLKLCSDKGIEPDKRMTKAEIIDLLRGRL